MRWLGPLAARHFLRQAGLTGDLRIEGSLAHGFTLADVRLEGSGVLAKLTLDRATAHYRWAEVIKGKLDGLTVDGLHVELLLDAPRDPSEEPSAPAVPYQLATTVRGIRSHVVPAEIHLTRISVTASKAGATLFAVAPSGLHHAAGADMIALQLGATTDATGRVWPAQTSTIGWESERITIDRLDPHPAVGVSDLVFHLPRAEEPSLETAIRIDDATLDLATTPGFANASLALRSGSLAIARSARAFGLELPASATLTSFSLDANDILPSPLAATANLALGLENVAYEDWRVASLALGTTVEADHATLTLHADALGTALHLDSNIALIRSADSLATGQATGTLQIPAVPALLRELAARYPAIKAPAATPESALAARFSVDLTDLEFHGAALDLTLAPEDPAAATPIAINARYTPAQPLAAELAIDGLKLDASYHFRTRIYEGKLALTDFSTTRIERWLAVAGVELPGTAGLGGTWQGGGDLTSNTHRGSLALSTASWQARPPSAEPGPEPSNLEPATPITATAALDYAWPAKVHVETLEAKAGNQTLTLAADLADDTLTLHRFLWLDGQTEIAEGTASLPLPADFANWRDAVSSDTRPAAIDIHSRVLSLGLLKPWLPEAGRLDPESTGQLRLKLAGSYSKPDLDLAVDVLNLRSPDNPELPPADLKLSLKAVDEQVRLNATVTAPDYPPAVLSASLPFHPAQWAAQPDLIQQEILVARLDLPRLELSRFTTLVPALRKLSGTVTGHVAATGPLSSPEATGAIRLENAALVLADPSLPPVNAAGATINFTLAKITLENLRATIAGGTLSGGGTLALTDRRPSAIDFRLRGDHLPLLRNDMLIVRANADLRLAGPWQTAALTGSVAVVDSLFYRDIELLPIGKPFTTPSAAALPKLDARATTGKATSAIPAPFATWTLGLDVRTRNPFLIRGNLATGQVDVALRALGTLGDPKLDGTATISNFTASLPFSTLRVRSGTVRFTPATGFDPILEIRGTAEPRPYRIEAYVYGRSSDPQLMLNSSPPLPETEIMTLLATGTTTDGLEDAGAATNRAIQLFAEEVRRGRVRYTKQLRPLLGRLDRVDFSLQEKDPYSTDSHSTATISLTDRWFLSAGMGDEGNTRVMGIWRMSFK